MNNKPDRIPLYAAIRRVLLQDTAKHVLARRRERVTVAIDEEVGLLEQDDDEPAIKSHDEAMTR